MNAKKKKKKFQQSQIHANLTKLKLTKANEKYTHLSKQIVVFNVLTFQNNHWIVFSSSSNNKNKAFKFLIKNNFMSKIYFLIF